MKKSRFTESQMVQAIKEHEDGRDAKDIWERVAICLLHRGYQKLHLYKTRKLISS